MRVVSQFVLYIDLYALLYYTKNIILFTDGMNTVGPRNCKDIISKLDSDNQEWSKTSINCCGFGNDVDLETLNQISKESESKIIVISLKSCLKSF
jgi:hypothetical protein